MSSDSDKTLTKAAAPVPLPCAATVPALASTAAKWKKDFSNADLTIGLTLGTAFLFLSVVDWSYAQFLLSQLQPHSCAPSHPIVHSLAQFYSWRLGGSDFLKYFDLFILATLPLVFYTLVADNIATIRGVRAPLGRHLLDLESLAQLLCVLFLTGAKAQPAMQRVVAAVLREGGEEGYKPSGAVLYAELSQLVNFHALILALNALQWFVPLLRLLFQRKQDAARAAEATRLALLSKRQAALEAKAAAAAAAVAAPTPEEMQRRMEEAEAAAMLAAQQAEDMLAAEGDDSELRKRK